MITEQQIRERAFHLWEQDGCKHGQADHYWLSAESEMRTTPVAAVAKKRTPVKKAEGSEAAPPRTTRQRKAPSEVRV
jgi:hypothetical protein